MMNRFQLVLLSFVLLAHPSVAQTATGAPPSIPARDVQLSIRPLPASTGTHAATNSTNAALQSEVDHLTQTNRDLLDLLKKQQGVLEDIQYDRRLQSRQIQSLEERLEETLLRNDQLQNKITNMETTATFGPSAASNGTLNTIPPNAVASIPPAPAPQPAPPPVPASALPPPDSEGAPGTMSWHRLFTLSGTDGKNSDLFQVQGRSWRILWHNEDKPGPAYKNTSALFINAFPKDDTIPQKVCAKLGSGGDKTELIGPGNYYLKVEASGGSWELAVEDFH